ncbi:MAG: ChaN family lipoprotein, partial [Acidobacteria bacterium]|nr:ChaN family lipoprotein [Acidobacteriota bacterium]
MMRVTLLITFSFLLALFLPAGIFAQVEQKPATNFRVYDSSGKTVTLDDVITAMSRAEVVFIGETHNDAVAHLIELQLLQGAAVRYSSNADASARRRV